MVNHVELGMNVKTTFAKMASALVGLWNSLKNLPCLQNEIIVPTILPSKYKL